MVKEGPKKQAKPIEPTAIYFTKDLMDIFGVVRATIVRWRKRDGLPLTGAPRGFITGKSLLEWVERRGKQVTP